MPSKALNTQNGENKFQNDRKRLRKRRTQSGGGSVSVIARAKRKASHFIFILFVRANIKKVNELHIVHKSSFRSRFLSR